jgi:hypothetical protein
VAICLGPVLSNIFWLYAKAEGLLLLLVGLSVAIVIPVRPLLVRRR